MPDLDQAIEFLTRVLGCQLLYKTSAAFDSTGGDWMTRHYGVNARATLRTAMLRCGPTTNVELLQWEVPGSPSSPNDLAAASAGHLAIYVDDVRQAMEYLAAEPGVRILGAPTVVTGEPNEGTEFVFAQTPWGLYIELVRWPRLMPYCTLTPERLVNPATSWR